MEPIRAGGQLGGGVEMAIFQQHRFDRGFDRWGMGHGVRLGLDGLASFKPSAGGGETERHRLARASGRLQADWITVRKTMPAWLSILLVMILVAVLLRPGKDDFSWFLQLRRPYWLTFERLIPVIWMVIYACFYASALLSWQATAEVAA
jgi:hypothetical protein